MRFLLLLGLLAACGPSAFAQAAPKLDEKALRQAFEQTLKDAESARFRAIKYQPTGEPGGWTMCGEVNAKNSYGGYSGFEPFLGMAIRDGKSMGYLILGIGEASAAVCKEKGLR